MCWAGSLPACQPASWAGWAAAAAAAAADGDGTRFWESGEEMAEVPSRWRGVRFPLDVLHYVFVWCGGDAVATTTSDYIFF
mmetsp:Transcript_2975/g.5514  ORF Transcript_2975/g.5514 Transcript_2975/m.5514 type:complete len:81 (-) Transcript_2975:297-539(-)